MNMTLKALMKWSAALLLSLPLAANAAVSRPATPFTDAELDQMLAPIALYHDAVLSHVLIAATVPDEVEEAAEWSRRHPDLSGQAAVNAVEGRDWDPSVKALVAFPDVLARMDDDPEWTEDLGDAFLDQEGDVMDRVQYLRDRADANGSLDSVEHVRVVREREYIYIEPAVASYVYVPYYDPWYVYGSWWWPYYPPHHWAYWGGYPARHYYGAAFYWGIGFRLGPSYYYGRFNWHDRHVVTSRPHHRYSPSPGYSGRSDVRRHRNDTETRRPHDTRRHRDSRRPDWRHDNRRVDRRHDNRRTDPPRRAERRSSSEVRQQLSARHSMQRRESRASGSSRRWSERRESPRVSGSPSERRESRGWGGAQREARGRVERPQRAERAQHVDRPQRVERPQHVDRPSRDNGGGRGATPRGGVERQGGGGQRQGMQPRGRGGRAER